MLAPPADRRWSHSRSEPPPAGSGPGGAKATAQHLTERTLFTELGILIGTPEYMNPFVERVIGSIRRECLDHVIIWNERALRRHLQQYLAYDHGWWTHLSLDKDAPIPRATQSPSDGRIVAVPHVGGLHHHDERRAA